jgi:hypothetical protein
VLAFALSIALHEVVAGLIPYEHPRPPLTQILVHERIVTVTLRPTPKPRALSTPRATIHHRSVVAVQQTKIVRSAQGGRRGRAAHRAPALIAPAHVAYDSLPVWDVGRGQSNAGKGLSKGGAGAGTGPGPGASADAPCGFVTFSNPHGSHYDPSTHGFWVDIRMAVHFSDGSSQSMMLDYPWYYSSEAANPWSDQNLKDPSFPTRLQTPPPSKMAAEPPLVQYVIAHSTPDGMTLLHDCPQTSPTPAT